MYDLEGIIAIMCYFLFLNGERTDFTFSQFMYYKLCLYTSWETIYHTEVGVVEVGGDGGCTRYSTVTLETEVYIG